MPFHFRINAVDLIACLLTYLLSCLYVCLGYLGVVKAISKDGVDTTVAVLTPWPMIKQCIINKLEWLTNQSANCFKYVIEIPVDYAFEHELHHRRSEQRPSNLSEIRINPFSSFEND